MSMREIMELVEIKKTPKPRYGIDSEYEVTRKKDGKLLGWVVRKLYKPDVNYPGTRIRKLFKGSPKWFAVLPFGVQKGEDALSRVNYWRLPRDSRWQAIKLLLEQ